MSQIYVVFVLNFIIIFLLQDQETVDDLLARALKDRLGIKTEGNFSIIFLHERFMKRVVLSKISRKNKRPALKHFG